MKQAVRAALFSSVLLGMGILFGVYIAYFARQFANNELAKSRRQRSADADEGNIIPDYSNWKGK